MIVKCGMHVTLLALKWKEDKEINGNSERNNKPKISSRHVSRQNEDGRNVDWYIAEKGKRWTMPRMNWRLRESVWFTEHQWGPGLKEDNELDNDGKMW